MTTHSHPDGNASTTVTVSSSEQRENVIQQDMSYEISTGTRKQAIQSARPGASLGEKNTRLGFLTASDMRDNHNASYLVGSRGRQMGEINKQSRC